jgi:hypothetical protein
MTKDNAVTAAELAWRYDCTTRQVDVLGIPNAFHFEEPSRTILDRICRDRLEDMAMQRGFAVLARAAGQWLMRRLARKTTTKTRLENEDHDH